MNLYPNFGKPKQLLIKELLIKPSTWSPKQSIVYRDQVELTYEQFIDRVRRLGAALVKLGVKQGDRVGVMDWDSHRYLELFFAIPMVGAVLHTINIRLSPEQTLYTVAHAEDCVLFVSTDFTQLVAELAPRVPSLRRTVLMADAGHKPHPSFKPDCEYEALLAESDAGFQFPDFDENAIATMMYTTGTTGDPKGVYFSHRQIVLHTLSVGLAVSSCHKPFGLTDTDVYMPLTPMFHVHAWGIPYLAVMLGIKQVYPGRYEPQMIRNLIYQHRPTFTHCVPTILQMLLHHPACKDVDLKGLKVLIGGAALSKGMARESRQRGMEIMGGYGMSETCPVVAVSQIKPETETGELEDELEYTTRTGFPMALVETKILDANGNPLPPGRENFGELVVQAPWLTQGYFKEEAKSQELWKGGWLHTGDVAYMDTEGYIRITDRLKDVIKIGGEWISSLELENALSQHPAVKEVAVVGIPDAKWDERPYAEVVLKETHSEGVSSKDLHHFLHGFIDKGLIHKRAILTEVAIVTAIPKTGVGKLDKKMMRSHHHPRKHSAQ